MGLLNEIFASDEKKLSLFYDVTFWYQLIAFTIFIFQLIYPINDEYSHTLYKTPKVHIEIHYASYHRDAREHNNRH